VNAGDGLQAVRKGATIMMLIVMCLGAVALLVVGVVAFMRR
jgi:hypothetical protein